MSFIEREEVLNHRCVQEPLSRSTRRAGVETATTREKRPLLQAALAIVQELSLQGCARHGLPASGSPVACHTLSGRAQHHAHRAGTHDFNSLGVS